MKLKVLKFVAEYFVFLGACIVMVLVVTQSNIYDGIKMFGELGITVITLWFLGAFLKYTIRKERPEGGFMNMSMRDRYTFPSMHALTLSSATYFVYMHNLSFGMIMILVTLLVLVARVQTRMHYIIDMVAGVLVGVLFTSTVLPYIESVVFRFI